MKYALISEEQIKRVQDALNDAQIFIRNGVALGFIRMPDLDCPDPAHNTPKHISQALTTVKSLKPSEPVAWRYEISGDAVFTDNPKREEIVRMTGIEATPLFALEQSK